MANGTRDTGWFKSSHSGSGNDQCVECRLTTTAVGVRDSKNPDGPRLSLDYPTWTAFLTAFVQD